MSRTVSHKSYVCQGLEASRRSAARGWDHPACRTSSCRQNQNGYPSPKLESDQLPGESSADAKRRHRTKLKAGECSIYGPDRRTAWFVWLRLLLGSRLIWSGFVGLPALRTVIVRHEALRAVMVRQLPNRVGLSAIFDC
jgi:hypothetical protein